MKYTKVVPAAVLSQTSLESAVELFDNGGADEILIWDNRADFKEREGDLIGRLSGACALMDTPLMVYQVYERFEDIKKIIYAGAARVIMNPLEGGRCETLKEGIARFGQENVIGTLLGTIRDRVDEKAFLELVALSGCKLWLLSLGDLMRFCNGGDFEAAIRAGEIQVMVALGSGKLTVEDAQWVKVTGARAVTWIDTSDAGDTVTGGTDFDVFSTSKMYLSAYGIPMQTFESSMPFSDFKLNSDGLIPVVTQDYKTGKVLMVAYMNEASYNETIRSGRMTYYSRSRKCLWKKGDTSGHYQFVKSLDIDCDRDTILAKVKQIGPACHTGSESCFFTNLAKKEYDDVNPATILQEIMDTVSDRKAHPKEGSYTNYLFDKGIDKILKKVGEEATEIVIAAKNPDASELKYEISDFLYHMIVLMVERGVGWDEISQELAKRH